MTTPAVPNTPRRMLLVILAIFLVPMLLAGVLRFADIHPAATKQHGELLDPPADFREARLRLPGGGVYDWTPVERTWRVLVPAPATCGDECRRVAHDVDTVWQSLNKDSLRVDVLWWCAEDGCAWPADVHQPSTLRLLAPDAALRGRLPKLDAAAGLPVYVVDPNGFVILRYEPGADLFGLRGDLNRLLKLQ